MAKTPERHPPQESGPIRVTIDAALAQVVRSARDQFHFMDDTEFVKMMVRDWLALEGVLPRKLIQMESSKPGNGDA
jgi:hypothetical protein